MADKITLQDLKQIVKDLGEAQQKTAIAQQKTEAAQQKTEAAQQKTEAAQQKTQQALDRLAAEHEKTEKVLRKAIGNINDRWGQFMENLVKEDLLNLMQEKGIAVHELHPNVEAMSRGEKKRTCLAEFDLLAVNGDELVVVETKTTLFTKDVVAFVEKLKKFKSYFPLYKNHRVYGAVAFMGEGRTDKGKAAVRAEEAGLFVIKSPEGAPGMAILANAEGFQPRQF